MKNLFEFTDLNLAGLFLRLTLGLIMFPHGAQKLLGLFGGHGFKPSMNFFTGVMKLPKIIAFLVIVLEFFCSVALVAGFATSISALVFIVIMAGAIKTTNLQNGFFMNWFGNQKGEGYEFHLLVIGIGIALLFTGSGPLAIDNLIGWF